MRHITKTSDGLIIISGDPMPAPKPMPGGGFAVTTDDPELCRAIGRHPNFTDAELYKGGANGHKFAVGETRTLHGLVSYPEHNGETVEITAIREDGPNGKAYYVKGAINEAINWVYESRLK